jgi:hypothetical protein
MPVSLALANAEERKTCAAIGSSVKIQSIDGATKVSAQSFPDFSRSLRCRIFLAISNSFRRSALKFLPARLMNI